MMKIDNILFHDMPVHWSLVQNEPDLYATLKELIPALSVANEITSFPAQKLAKQTKDTETIVRPHRHWRAFYYPLTHYRDDYVGYLALKGTEVLSENIPELLDKIKSVHSIYSRSARKSGWGLLQPEHALLPMYDRFLFIENKVPLLYMLSEATAAVESSITLQKDYLKSYQAVANIPIPIAVYTIPEKSLVNVYTLFKAFYDVKRYQRIKELMQQGIAVQIYWYPCVPQRAAYIDFPSATSQESFQQRLQFLARQMDVKYCIEHWILLFSRFLNLGYVLADPTDNQGYCIDPGNLVLDGGIVDLNHVRSLDSFHYAGEKQFVVQNSIELLVNGIMTLLVGHEAASFGFKSVFPDLMHNIYREIEKNIDMDLKAGRFVHPFVKQWQQLKPGYLGIIEKLTDFFEL